MLRRAEFGKPILRALLGKARCSCDQRQPRASRRSGRCSRSHEHRCEAETSVAGDGDCRTEPRVV